MPGQNRTHFLKLIKKKTNKVSKLDSLLQPLILNYFIITNENVKKLIKYY